LFARRISGRPCEVAESLKRGHVSCVAMLARKNGEANLGCPTDASWLGEDRLRFTAVTTKRDGK